MREAAGVEVDVMVVCEFVSFMNAGSVRGGRDGWVQREALKWGGTEELERWRPKGMGKFETK